MKKDGEILRTVLTLLLVSFLILQPIRVAYAFDYYAVPIVPSLPELPDVPTQEDIDESVESIERRIQEWKRFVSQASDFETAVAEISSTFANYLKSMTKMDASCRKRARIASEQAGSAFKRMYERAVNRCKKNVRRHKELGKIYADDITRLTELATQTAEAVNFALEEIPSLEEDSRAARIRDQLKSALGETKNKFRQLQENQPQ